jgi:hypothetical protein
MKQYFRKSCKMPSSGFVTSGDWVGNEEIRYWTYRCRNICFVETIPILFKRHHKRKFHQRFFYFCGMIKSLGNG